MLIYPNLVKENGHIDFDLLAKLTYIYQIIPDYKYVYSVSKYRHERACIAGLLHIFLGTQHGKDFLVNPMISNMNNLNQLKDQGIDIDYLVGTIIGFYDHHRKDSISRQVNAITHCFSKKFSEERIKKILPGIHDGFMFGIHTGAIPSNGFENVLNEHLLPTAKKLLRSCEE